MCVLGFKCELVLCVQDKLHLFRTKPFNLIYCGKRWTRKDSAYGTDHSLRRRSLHIVASVRAAGTGDPAKQSRGQLVCLVEAISIFSIMTWEGIPPNGVDLVRQIYHTDPGGKIVFVTGHGEKGMDILRSGVRPFGFIENVWIRMRWFGSIFDI